MLLLLALVPFAISSAVVDAIGVPERHVYPISEAPRSSAAASHVDLHVNVTAIDSLQRMATLRVSGSQTCQPACGWSDKVVLFSLADQASGAAGLPPSASVTLPPTSAEVSQTVQLPTDGLPIHYPFDTYKLLLGVAVQRVQPDGTQQTLMPAQVAGQLVMTLQAEVPGLTLAPPVRVDPGSVRGDLDQYQLLYVSQLAFFRPPYLWLLSVLLVTLAAASAVYAVFMRDLKDLIVNSGGVILGLWGIRSVLTSGGPSIVTLVDLWLSTVILFLLGAMTARTLWFVFKRAELDLLLLFRRRPRQ
jgi:hypothetical protein